MTLNKRLYMNVADVLVAMEMSSKPGEPPSCSPDPAATADTNNNAGDAKRKVSYLLYYMSEFQRIQQKRIQPKYVFLAYQLHTSSYVLDY